MARLYEAMRAVLAEAIETLRARVGEAIDVEVRDFLAVHGKAGQPCPRCGSDRQRGHARAPHDQLLPHLPAGPDDQPLRRIGCRAARQRYSPCWQNGTVKPSPKSACLPQHSRVPSQADGV